MVVARERGLRSRRGDGSRVNDLELGNKGRPLAMLSSDDAVAVGDGMVQRENKNTEMYGVVYLH